MTEHPIIWYAKHIAIADTLSTLATHLDMVVHDMDRLIALDVALFEPEILVLADSMNFSVATVGRMNDVLQQRRLARADAEGAHMANWSDDPVPPGHGEDAPAIVEKEQRCWCGRILRKRGRFKKFLACPQHGAQDPKEDSDV